VRDAEPATGPSHGVRLWVCAHIRSVLEFLDWLGSQRHAPAQLCFVGGQFGRLR
jgi:hypothetical protein